MSDTQTEQNGKNGVQHVTIKPPRFGNAVFHVRGTAPLIVHRFSKKTKMEMMQKMITGKASSSRKNREPKSLEELYNESYYKSPEGWYGIHASCIRNASISACRLVGFKMVLAKLSIFVIADGWDEAEPQIPLIRIYGEPVMQTDIARVETGQPYVTVRAAFHQWELKPRIRWDMDQFTLSDVTNLVMRVGLQVGICEGRPDSKNSAGMGWGVFELVNEDQPSA